MDETLTLIADAGRSQEIYLPENEVTLSGRFLTLSSSAGQDVQVAWNRVNGPARVDFENRRELETKVTFEKAGKYTFQLTVKDETSSHTDNVRVVVHHALGPTTGGLLREVWLDGYFPSVVDLLDHDNYPEYPTLRDQIADFEAPINWADRYATRIRGHLHPPETGVYRFWISGDDDGELWLSEDDHPSKKQRIAFLSRATGIRNFDKNESQASEAYLLEGGKHYYIEVIHREQGGQDHVAVAWLQPGREERSLLSRSFLSPWEKAPLFDESMNLVADAGRDLDIYWPNKTVELTGRTLDLTAVSDGESAKPQATWSLLSGSGKATIRHPESLETRVNFTKPGSYTLRLTAEKDEQSHADELRVTLHPRLSSKTGSLLREVWLNVPGYYVSDLTTHERFQEAPSLIDEIRSLEPPSNWSFNYGTRLRGFVHPPKTGKYTFWIAGDERAELWLSASASEGKKEKIAELSDDTGVRQWDRMSEQRSDQMELRAGRKYYIEVLHKERTGSDHVAVAWEGPGLARREVIHGSFLSPFKPARDHNKEFQVMAGEDQVLFWPEQTLEVISTVYDLEQGPKRISFLWTQEEGPGKVTFEDAKAPVSFATFSEPGSYRLKMTATDGRNSGEDSLVVTVREPLGEATGSVLREVWLDRFNVPLPSLRDADIYLGEATFSDELPFLDLPSDWMDQYGTRIRGFLHPPTSGIYTFWIAGDDRGEIWLSPDEDPEKRRRIALLPSHTSFHEWDRYDQQQSEPLHLEAGKRYFLEVVHTESWGGDHVAVAWSAKDLFERKILTGAFLSPWKSARAHDAEILVLAGANQRLRWPEQTVELTGKVLDLTPGPFALQVEWRKVSGPGDVRFQTATLTTTRAQFSRPGNYRVSLVGDDGIHQGQDDLKITIRSAVARKTGSILREIWSDVPGTALSALLSDHRYPHAPTARIRESGLRVPANQADHFGTRLRGYLHPPQTGDYTFWISSDDQSQLWLRHNPSSGAKTASSPSLDLYRAQRLGQKSSAAVRKNFPYAR